MPNHFFPSESDKWATLTALSLSSSAFFVPSLVAVAERDLRDSLYSLVSANRKNYIGVTLLVIVLTNMNGEHRLWEIGRRRTIIMRAGHQFPPRRVFVLTVCCNIFMVYYSRARLIAFLNFAHGSWIACFKLQWGSYRVLDCTLPVVICVVNVLHFYWCWCVDGISLHFTFLANRRRKLLTQNSPNTAVF